jgi:hypothetical protein
MGLSFTNAAGPRQHSHSQVRAPRDSLPHFTVSDSRLPQPGGPGPSIDTSHEQGGPVIAPGTGFPFHHLLRLAGLRWRYSIPPPWLGLSLSLMLRQTVCRPVYLGIKHQSGAYDYYYSLTVASLLIWVALSNERPGLSFTIPAGPRQRSHFLVRVP